MFIGQEVAMLSKQVEQAIENLRDDEKRQAIEFINYLLWRQKHAEKRQPTKYDFTDIAGKLTWRGDAVAVQREMRDEW